MVLLAIPKNNIMKNTDITDPERDQPYLQGDKATLDLPDLSDIPGQQHVQPAPFGELADTTVSSADEEGTGLLDKEDSDGDVTDEEVELLRRADEEMPDSDDSLIRDAALDSADDEGGSLNEEGLENDFGGSDLDVPGAGEDDGDEEIGAEDEENNAYSISDNRE